MMAFEINVDISMNNNDIICCVLFPFSLQKISFSLIVFRLKKTFIRINLTISLCSFITNSVRSKIVGKFKTKEYSKIVQIKRNATEELHNYLHKC